MPPKILLDGFFIFFAILTLHFLVWRLVRVKKEIAWLIGIFILAVLPVFFSLIFWRVFSLSESLAVALFYFALAMAYLQTYPALKTDIPTFRILLFIRDHPGEAQNFSELCEKIGGSKGLHHDKVAQMCDDGLAFSENGRLQLSLPGKILADFFIAYRCVLGLKEGDG